MKKRKNMKYRYEIDGLRAIAVIPVIFFHAGVEYFSGGFVGVDIFFVISGYLITTIILSEKERGDFSLLNFYQRRARRILPALFFVMLVSLPIAWLVLLPYDMKNFSQSLVAVSVFASNVLFWIESGYWGTANELKPLLHTWSLAIEEQFYIIFPLFLVLMWKFRKRWILTSLIIITLISLSISQWTAYNRPTANFFSLHTRAWELALGACIAFYFLYRKKTVHSFIFLRIVDEALGFLGLIMIAYAVFVFNQATPFPSFYALVPTVGAALIILFSSTKTFVGRLLGMKIFVGIGLISYSAYLWHQPLIAFFRHASFTEPSNSLMVIVAITSFPIAYLSWKFIETPFRRKKFKSKTILIYSAIGSTIFITIGMAGVVTDGFGSRLAKNQLTLSSIEKKRMVASGLGECDDNPVKSPDCRTSDEPKILIWGDSYAMHLIPGILASNPDAKIIEMTKGRCGPFFSMAPVNIASRSIAWSRECLEFTEKVHKWIKVYPTIKYAVLSSPFHQYMASKILLRSGTQPYSNPLMLKEFEKTLIELEAMGIKPIIFSPPPANGINLGRCLVKADSIGRNLNNCNFKKNNISAKITEVYHFLKFIDKKYKVVNLDALMCDAKNCKTHFKSTYYYYDAGHLTYDGSKILGKKYNFYKLITHN